MDDHERLMAYESLLAVGCSEHQALCVMRLAQRVESGQVDPTEPTTESKRLDFAAYLVARGTLSEEEA